MTEEIKETLEDVKRHLDYLEATKQCSIRDNEMKVMYNYITNLQKENEKLKEENKRIFSRVNDDELLISNAMNYAELQDYKSRNKKAIKWLERHIKMINGLAGNDDGLKGSIVLSDDVVAGALLNILQGGDE